MIKICCWCKEAVDWLRSVTGVKKWAIGQGLLAGVKNQKIGCKWRKEVADSLKSANDMQTQSLVKIDCVLR